MYDLSISFCCHSFFFLQGLLLLLPLPQAVVVISIEGKIKLFIHTHSSFFISLRSGINELSNNPPIAAPKWNC